MTRLIPGKTKVEIELFRGVTLGDVLVGGLAITMVLFVFLSTLPYKFTICIVIASVAGFLILRIDEQANYRYLLHILSHFGYTRCFIRRSTDETLLERAKEASHADGEQAVMEPPKKESRAEHRARLKAERKAEQQERKEQEIERRWEDKMLKSKKVSEIEKSAVREIRREREESERAASMSAEIAEQVAKDTRKQDTRSQRKRGKAEKQAQKERKMAEKARVRARKEEDKKLKSKAVPEEEKQEIRSRRAAESAAAMRKMTEVKDEQTKRQSMDEIMGFSAIRDGCIEYGNKAYYGAAIEIAPVEFRFFSEHRRKNSIESALGRILRAISLQYSANIVKLERPVRYESYLDKEYEKLSQLRGSYESGFLTEEELQARVEIEYDRINELRSLCYEQQVVTSFYYLVLFESDKRQLELEISNAVMFLEQGEMRVHRLNDKELALFLKYSNAIDFDETEIDKIDPQDYAQWAKPQVVDIKARRVEINHIMTHNFRVVSYPSLVDDAWLASVMSIPATKVVVKAKPMDRVKAIRGIDRSLVELRGQWSSTGIDSKRLEIEGHLNTLQELLGTLQSENESLLSVNVYITAYDIVATRNNTRLRQPGESMLPTIADMKKTIRRTWRESGFRLNNMEFEQVQAFIASQISGLDPLSAQGRGIPSNTVAACYPWVYAHISDEGGVKLGESDGIPVFINFFRRDSERVNSNMVIVGKSGSGKSYATKSILSNLAADDAKIFILDPENEYLELAENLHGKIINVGNAQYGRLNPFHIITALDDDEAGEGSSSGSYATHLQFLEEFFRQILPDCDKDAMEYLNTMLDRLYSDFDISPDTDLSKLRPEDYPTFDDLYDSVLQEFQSTDNDYIRTMLRTLMNYISKFSTGGRNANIWNGPSTVTTDTNFTVFNFQSMLANRNTTIANAQMLLVLKYIDNEIIKNRDYNTRYKLSRKVVVVIDEAHVFIDTKFPIALDFMFQLAKRIRKYNGMQIVITQNIKDFVGSEEIARKSTAIINACQYSFIFSLAPNDIQDLVKLYEKAGGINETEQEQIVQAPRGQAFTIMSPTSRSTFHVQTGPSMTAMFENRAFVSRYFTGETGTANWEDFVGGSRQIHEETVNERYLRNNEAWNDDAFAEEVETGGKAPFGVAFEEISGEEYEKSRVSLEETSEEAETDFPRESAASGRAVLPEPARMEEPPQSPVEQLAAALARTLQKAGAVAAPAASPAPPAPPGDYGTIVSEVRREVEAQLGAEREAIRQERAQLSALMEQLRSMAADSRRDTGADSGGSDFEFEAEEAKAESSEEAKAESSEEEYGKGFSAYQDAGAETEDEEYEEDGAEAEDEEYEEDGAESGEEGEEEDFDLSAFLSRSVQRAQSLTFVDRMRREGTNTKPITWDELISYMDSRNKRNRSGYDAESA